MLLNGSLSEPPFVDKQQYYALSYLLAYFPQPWTLLFAVITLLIYTHCSADAFCSLSSCYLMMDRLTSSVFRTPG